MATRKAAGRSLTNKTCKQITDLVYNFLNDTLRPTVKKDFLQHLRLCPDCISFLNTYKKTVNLTRSLRAEDIPPKVRTSISDFLRRRIRKR
jgi:hypothetical protein